MSAYLTAALYKFVTLEDYVELRQPLLQTCEQNGIKGTLLLAKEGINGTIAGTPAGIAQVLAYLRSDPRLADLEHKEALAPQMPFYRLKVRLKREIVTMGVEDIDPNALVGTYVEPQDWNALISDPEVVVIDTRNDYEVAIGTFKGALNPQTKSFRELPQWLREQPLLQKKPKVAMFCTGGIRCEKSTALMRKNGFDEVYHLKGGILKYLETVPAENSLWEGDCFVFDERVGVGHGLQPSDLTLCRGCRHPLTPAEQESEHFIDGICCPHCHGSLTEEKRERLAERQHQMQLAEQRGECHLGNTQQL